MIMVSAYVASQVRAEPQRALLASWSYLTLLPPAIGLFGIHQWLSRRRGRNSGGGNFA